MIHNSILETHKFFVIDKRNLAKAEQGSKHFFLEKKRPPKTFVFLVHGHFIVLDPESQTFSAPFFSEKEVLALIFHPHPIALCKRGQPRWRLLTKLGKGDRQKK